MMKYFTFTFYFILFLCCNASFARSTNTGITIEYSENLQEGDILGISIYPPIGGSFYNQMMFGEKGQLDRNRRSISLEFAQTQSCFVPFMAFGKTYFAYAEPGDKIQINIGALPDKTVTFHGGKHSKVNNLYNEIVTSDYKKRIRDYIEAQIPLIKSQINDPFSNPNGVDLVLKDKTDPLTKIDQELEKLLAPFRSVNKEGLLSDDGLQRLMVALYADFYASTATMATVGGSGEVSEQQSVFLSHVFKEDIIRNPMLTRCRAGGSILIAYNSFIKITSPQLIQPSAEFIAAFGSINGSISMNTPEQQEFLLGRVFYLQEQMNVYDFDPANGFNSYKKMFPKSSLIPFLETVLPNKKLMPVRYKNSDNPVAKGNNSGVVLTMDDREIVIDTNVQVTTVKDFLSRYAKAKFTFVDIWATWCIPCLKEFANVKATEGIINSRQGGMVYISIDKGDQRAQWIELIQNRKLKGTHVLVSPALHEDLKKSYQVNTIPRYMIFDEKHQLFNMDAPRPSQQGDLINELSKLK